MKRRQILKSVILAPFLGLLKKKESGLEGQIVAKEPVKCNCGKPMPLIEAKQPTRYNCSCGRGYSWVKWDKDIVSFGQIT